MNEELEKKLKLAILSDKEVENVIKESSYVDLEDLFIKRKYPEPQPKTLNNMYSIFNQILVDFSIQRRGAWKEKQKKEYIESVIAGKAPTNILLANVRSCLEEAKKRNDLESIEYFENCLKEKKLYVSLDGNNRTQTINSLMKSELKFPDINITYKNDKDEIIELNLNNKDMKWLAKHHPGAELKIKTEFKMMVTEVTNASYKDLSTIFEQINELVALNLQEKRNATISSNMDAVRRITNLYKNNLYKLLNKETNKDRKEDQRLITGFLSIFHNNFIQTSNDIMDSLVLDDLKVESVEKLEEFMIVFNNFITPMVEGKKNNEKIMNFQTSITAFIFLNRIKELGYEITDYKYLSELFRIQESKRKKNIGNQRSYYTKLTGDSTASAFNKRKELINEELDNELEDLLNKNIIKKVKDLNIEFDDKPLNNVISRSEGTILRKKEEKVITNLETASINSFMDYVDFNIEDFLEKIQDKVLVNDNLQRSDVWESPQENKFIISLIKGMSYSNITVADVSKCKEYLNNNIEELEEQFSNLSYYFPNLKQEELLQKEIELDETIKDRIKSLEYYNDIQNKGYDYISIDGNNRTKTIAKLISGEIKFPEIIIKNKISDTEFNYINLKGLTFPELKQMGGTFKDIVKLIEKTPVGITKINKIDIQGLHEIFLRINEGIELNKQEIRNCIKSEVSNYIREISSDFQDKLIEVFSSKTNKEYYIEGKKVSYDYLRRVDEEAITKCLNYFFNKNDSVKRTFKLNNLINVYGETLTDDIKNEFKVKFNATLKMTKNNKNITAAELTTRFIFIEELYKQNIKILDFEKLEELYLKQEEIRRKSFEIDNDGNKYNAYFEAKRKLAGSENFDIFVDYIKKDINETFLNNNKNILIKLGKRTSFTNDEKIQIWEKQGRKSIITGLPIPFEDLFDSKLFEVDHTVPFSKGGSNDINNLQLLEKKVNREKSDLDMSFINEKYDIKGNLKREVSDLIKEGIKELNIKNKDIVEIEKFEEVDKGYKEFIIENLENRSFQISVKKFLKDNLGGSFNLKDELINAIENLENDNLVKLKTFIEENKNKSLNSSSYINTHKTR